MIIKLTLKVLGVCVVGLTLVGCGGSGTSSGTTTDTTTTTDTSTFSVTSPNGGESWELSTTYDIKWNTESLGGDAIIELRTGSGTSGSTALEISAQTPNDGSYSWKIPTTVATGSNYSIRVRSIINEDKVDSSDTTFSVSEESVLKLTSSAFTAGGQIPTKYTCDGDDASPPLTISGVSSDAKELVLFLDDLDGTKTANNTTTDWNHWVVFNIPVNSPSFPVYSIPNGAVEGRSDDGDRAYDPICPPGETSDRNKHNYRFTLYTIDKTLTNDSASTRSQIKNAITESIVQKTTLTAYFGSD